MLSRLNPKLLWNSFVNFNHINVKAGNARPVFLFMLTVGITGAYIERFITEYHHENHKEEVIKNALIAHGLEEH